MERINQRMEAMLVWLGPILLMLGFATHQLWKQAPIGRFGELVLLALVALGFAKLAGRFLPWSRASLIALLWYALLLIFAGPVPVLATTVLFLATTALGGAAFPQRPILLQTLLGTLLLAGLVGWLLPLPIHYRWVYLLLCAGLIAWRHRSLRASLRQGARQWSEAVSAAPRMAAFAVIVVGLAATACWLPTLQYDDLAYHLRLPWQLQEQGFYAPEPQFQIWALAPWLSDVVHALAQLVSGAEARGPVNAAWLLILGAGLWRLSAHLEAPPAARWLAIALAASLPLTAAAAGGMQTELLTAALLTWLMALAAAPRDGSFRFWLVLAVLAGGLMALKLVAGVMASAVLLWALIRHPWPSALRILALLGVGLAVAGSSYAYAGLTAGNPLLPLFNGWFQSPYFAPVNFIDARWQTGLGADLLWDMTFDTDRYMEAYDGGGGFMLIALSGVWLLSFFRRGTRAAALVATVVLLLPLLPMQYLRYAYPGLVLLCAVLAASAAAAHDHRRASWLLIAVCVLNLGYQANGNWMLRLGAVKQTIQVAGNDVPLFTRFTPERVLAAAIRESGQTSGNVLVLDAGQPYTSEFGRRGRSVAWYSPKLAKAAALAQQDPSGQAWAELIRQQQVRHVILRKAKATPAQRQALQVLGAEQRSTVGETEWWMVPAQPQP